MSSSSGELLHPPAGDSDDTPLSSSKRHAATHRGTSSRRRTVVEVGGGGQANHRGSTSTQALLQGDDPVHHKLVAVFHDVSHLLSSSMNDAATPIVKYRPLCDYDNVVTIAAMMNEKLDALDSPALLSLARALQKGLVALVLDLQSFLSSSSVAQRSAAARRFSKHEDVNSVSEALFSPVQVSVFSDGALGRSSATSNTKSTSAFGHSTTERDEHAVFDVDERQHSVRLPASPTGRTCLQPLDVPNQSEALDSRQSLGAASTESAGEIVTPTIGPVVTSNAQHAVDEIGMKVVNEYTFLKELGRGRYGKVKLASTAEGGLVAIKIVPHSYVKQYHLPSDPEGSHGSGRFERGADEQSPMEREVAVMSKLRHKNVLRLREVIDDPEAKNIYLVMNYAERGPLVTMRPDGTCTPLQFDVARGYMRQLLNGLQYLHNHGVCHRDIKPDNILLGANGVVYFSDFGVSSFFRGAGDAFVQCEGTPAYHSPEIARGEAFAGPPADVWALGVAFYCMVYGRLPFRGDTPRDLRRAIVEDDVAFPELFGDEEQQLRDAEFSSSDDDRSSSRGNSSVMAASNASQSFNVSSMGWSAVQAEQIHQDVVDLLRRMLEKDPKKRITVQQCRRHPVVRDVMRGANQTRVGRLKSVSRGAHEKSSKQATGHRDSDELVTAEQVAESTPSRVVDGAETIFGINSASQLSLEAFSPLDMLFQRNEGSVASSPSRRVGGPLPPEQTAAAERFRRRHLDQHTPSSPSTDAHSSGSAGSPKAEH